MSLTHIHAGRDGSPPLRLEERDGLIRTYIATRDELNAAEQANIVAAMLGFGGEGSPPEGSATGSS